MTQKQTSLPELSFLLFIICLLFVLVFRTPPLPLILLSIPLNHLTFLAKLISDVDVNVRYVWDNCPESAVIDTHIVLI